MSPGRARKRDGLNVSAETLRLARGRGEALTTWKVPLLVEQLDMLEVEETESLAVRPRPYLVRKMCPAPRRPVPSIGSAEETDVLCGPIA